MIELNQEKSDALKKESMQRALFPEREELLINARRAARIISDELGFVTADKVVRYMWVNYSIDLPIELGNGMGSIFKGSEWKFIEWVKSARPSNHSRYIRKWVWRP